MLNLHIRTKHVLQQLSIPVLGILIFAFLSIFIPDFKLCIPDIFSELPQSSSMKQKEKDYISKIILNPFRIKQTSSGTIEIVGEIKNAGTVTLSRVSLTIYLLDKNGKPIHDLELINVFEDKYLKPNYIKKYYFNIDDVPSEWARKIKGEVWEVKFKY